MDNKCQNWRFFLDLSDLEKWPLERFNQIQLISTIPGKVHAKIEKTLLTNFWENALKCKKGTLFTFKTQPL